MQEVQKIVRNFERTVAGLPAEVPMMVWSGGPSVPAFTHVPADRYFREAEACLKAMLAFYHLLPEVVMVPGLIPDFGVAPQPSAFGAKIRYFANQAPHADTCVTIEQIPHLKPSNPKRDGVMPEFFAALQYFCDHLPPDLCESYCLGHAVVLGPMDLAGLILGYGELYEGFYTHPAEIHQLLKITTESVISYIKAHEPISGPIRRLTLADHQSAMISRAQVEEFWAPYIRQVVAEFPGAMHIYHNESNTSHMMDMIPELGFTVFHMGNEVKGDYAEGLRATKAAIGDRVTMMGNMHSQDILLRKTAAEIYQEAVRQLEVGAPNGRFVLAVRAGFAPETPIENVRAMIQAGLDWNRKKILAMP